MNATFSTPANFSTARGIQAAILADLAIPVSIWKEGGYLNRYRLDLFRSKGMKTGYTEGMGQTVKPSELAKYLESHADEPHTRIRDTLHLARQALKKQKAGVVV